MREYKYGMTEEQKNDLDKILSDIRGAVKNRRHGEVIDMLRKGKDIILNLHRFD